MAGKLNFITKVVNVKFSGLGVDRVRILPARVESIHKKFLTLRPTYDCHPVNANVIIVNPPWWSIVIIRQPPPLIDDVIFGCPLIVFDTLS